MVQIDNSQRHVCIKLCDSNRLKQVLHLTGGQAEYRHTNGEISRVRVETAGLGTRRARIANLPPEMPEEVIRTIMTRFGEVKDVQAETWARFYLYKVPNGVRIAVMTLSKHIPSNITIAGHRALVSYEGQPMTCYRCLEIGHFYQASPMRQRTGEIGHTATATTWADIAAQGAGGTRRGREAVDEGERRRIHIVREERESEKNRGIHTEEQKTRYQGGQEQRHISEQEKTDSSNTMETVTPQDSAPEPTAENQMEYEGGMQEEEIEETIDRAPSTQQKSNMRATNRM